MQYTAGMPERECEEQEKEDLAKRTKERGESGTGKTVATFAEPLKLLLFTVYILSLRQWNEIFDPLFGKKKPL